MTTHTLHADYEAKYIKTAIHIIKSGSCYGINCLSCPVYDTTKATCMWRSGPFLTLLCQQYIDSAPNDIMLELLL